MKTWWMSFVSNDSEFLGACLVDAVNEAEAVRITWNLKINPGGEVMITEFPTRDPEAIKEIERLGKNRLFSEAELMSDGSCNKIGDLPKEIQDKIESDLDHKIFCEHNNKPE